MGPIPPLRSIYYHITHRCNLRCKHCWVDAGKGLDNELSSEEAKQVVTDALALGLGTMKFTGGEPFLVPWVLDLAEYGYKNKLRNITFETNGTLITAELAARLRGIEAAVAISLDGATPQTHEAIRGVKGCFEATVQGLKNLVGAGVRPGILIAVDRTNLDEIPDVLNLARQLDVRRAKINVMTPTGRGRALGTEGHLLTLAERTALFERTAEWQNTYGVSLSMAFPPLLCAASKMKTSMCQSCVLEQIVGLLADGRLAICGIGSVDANLVFGNVRETSLREIWEVNPPPILRQIRQGLPDHLTGVCAECIFKSYCKGSCRAQAFQAYGTITAPSPLCQQAWEADEVPSGRVPAYSGAAESST